MCRKNKSIARMTELNHQRYADARAEETEVSRARGCGCVGD